MFKSNNIMIFLYIIKIIEIENNINMIIECGIWVCIIFYLNTDKYVLIISSILLIKKLIENKDYYE